MIIREEIDLLDETNSIAAESSNRENIEVLTGIEHITVGSPSNAISFAALESQYSMDVAFKNFRTKTQKYLSNYYSKPIRFTPEQTVSIGIMYLATKPNILNTDYSIQIAQGKLCINHQLEFRDKYFTYQSKIPWTPKI